MFSGIESTSVVRNNDMEEQDRKQEQEQHPSDEQSSSSSSAEKEHPVERDVEEIEAVVDDNRRILRDRTRMRQPVYKEEDSIISVDDSFFCVSEIIEPVSYREAVRSKESSKWIEAMRFLTSERNRLSKDFQSCREVHKHSSYFGCRCI